MIPSKLQEVARLWSLALAMSALLALAGQRWPRSLPIVPSVVAALVLGPPLLMALVLLARWRLGEAPEGGESVAPAQERH
jgi:hypothetical protein